MALKQAFSVDHLGLNLPDAYLKIRNVHLDHQTMTATVLVFNDEQARTDGKQPVTEFHHHEPMDMNMTKNPFAVVYAKMKLTDKFKDAVDV